MQYLAPLTHPTLTTLAAYADRTQAMLDPLLTDIEQMPPSSVQFRVNLLGKVTDFIYRLTSIQKTIIALRGGTNLNLNLASLQALTATTRTLHQQIQALQASVPTPPTENGPPVPHRQEWGRLAPTSLSPTTNPVPSNQSTPVDCETSLSPTPAKPAPRISTNTLGQASAAAIHRSEFKLQFEQTPPPFLPNFTPAKPNTHSLTPPRYTLASPPQPKAFFPTPRFPNSLHPVETHSTVISNPIHPINPMNHPNPVVPISTPNHSNLPINHPISDTPELLLPNPTSPTPDPLRVLLARIPLSITDPEHTLPAQSNLIADFAPLYNLDLIPKTPSVPTLPFTPEQLQSLPTKLETHCNHLTSNITNLRADILYNPPSNPSEPASPLKPKPKFTRRNPPIILTSDKPYDFKAPNDPKSQVEAAFQRLATFYEYPNPPSPSPTDP